MESPIDACVMTSIVMNLLVRQVVEYGPMVAIVAVAKISLIKPLRCLQQHKHLQREALLVLIKMVVLATKQIHVFVTLLTVMKLFAQLPVDYGRMVALVVAHLSPVQMIQITYIQQIVEKLRVAVG